MSLGVPNPVITVDADINPLRQEFLKAQAVMRESFGQMQAHAAAAAQKLVLVGAAAAGAFTVLAKESFQSIDALAKTADRLGVTTEALRTLQVAADLAGVGQEQLTKSLQKQQKALFDASQGSASAVEAFRQLGLNVQQLMALPADQQFESIANAIAGVDNVTRRNALAMQIWGARAAEMINFAAEAGGGVGELRDLLDDLNVTVNRFDASKIEQSNDAVSIAKLAFEGLGNTIAVAVSPYVTALAEDFTAAARASGGFRVEVQSSVESAAKSIGWLGDNILRISQFWDLAAGGAASFSVHVNEYLATVAKGFELVLTPFSLFMKVIEKSAAALGMLPGAAGRAFKDLAETMQNLPTPSNLVRFFEDSADSAQTDANKIFDALSASLSRELPSTAIDKWLADARAKADALAAEMAKTPRPGAGVDSTGAADAVFARDAALGQHLQKLDKAIAPKVEMPEIDMPRAALMDVDFIRQSTAEATAAYLDTWRMANEQRVEMESQLRQTLLSGDTEAGAALVQLAAQHAREKVMAEYQARGEAMSENGEFLDPQAKIEFELAVQEETLALEQDYLNRRLAMQQQFGSQYIGIQNAITALMGKTWSNAHKQTLQNVSTFAGAAMSITQSMFGQNKKVAIAQAIISTLAGAANALDDLPFPANIAAAASVLAQGYAQVNAIKGTNIGSTGIGGSIGGGGLSSAPTQQPIENGMNAEDEKRRSSVQVVFQGDVVGWDDFMRDRFVSSLRDIVDGNDVILFSGSSRQAAEIRGG